MEKKNTVPMLEKALDILEYIAANETAVSLPELQANLGIAQASCYRLAATLVQRGWLEKCSGNRYEIAAGISPVADKLRFRLERYKHLQPVMNRIANLTGFSAKLSVRDGDEFVNVCSAQCRSEMLSFSEPGFRSPLKEIASVSAVFLSECPESERRRLVGDKDLPLFQKLNRQYREHGYCFIRGQMEKDSKYPFDTLSIPVKRQDRLRGVISFLSMPGVLAGEKDRIRKQLDSALHGILNRLEI